MAYGFNKADGTHSYLRTSGSVYNFQAGLWTTVGLRFYARNTTTNHTLFKAQLDATTNNRLLLYATGDTTGGPKVLKATYQLNDTTSYTCSTTASYSAETWHYALCLLNGYNKDLFCSLDGGTLAHSKIKDTTNAPFYYQVGGDNFFIPAIDGSICDFAVWNNLVFDGTATLTVPGIRALTAGWAPPVAQPKGLKYYAPLISGTQAWVGGVDLTGYNDPVVGPHPKVWF